MSEIITAQNEIFKVVISKALIGYNVSLYKVGKLEKKYKAFRTKGKLTEGCFVYNIPTSMEIGMVTVYTKEKKAIITPVNGMEIYLSIAD